MNVTFLCHDLRPFTIDNLNKLKTLIHLNSSFISPEILHIYKRVEFIFT